MGGVGGGGTAGAAGWRREKVTPEEKTGREPRILSERRDQRHVRQSGREEHLTNQSDRH